MRFKIYSACLLSLVSLFLAMSPASAMTSACSSVASVKVISYNIVKESVYAPAKQFVMQNEGGILISLQTVSPSPIHLSISLTMLLSQGSLPPPSF